MDALTKIAVAKAIKAADLKVASEELEAGEHDVDVLVRVTGSLKKGEDYDQKIVAKADPWLLLAVALSHMNGATVESIVTEALNHDPEMAKSVKKTATDAIGQVVKPTWTRCNGKVNTKLTATAVMETADLDVDAGQSVVELS